MDWDPRPQFRPGTDDVAYAWDRLTGGITREHLRELLFGPGDWLSELSWMSCDCYGDPPEHGECMPCEARAVLHAWEHDMPVTSDWPALDVPDGEIDAFVHMFREATQGVEGVISVEVKERPALDEDVSSV